MEEREAAVGECRGACSGEERREAERSGSISMGGGLLVDWGLGLVVEEDMVVVLGW